MSLSKSAPVELDFFRMERENHSPVPSPTPPPPTFQDVQREVSKLNPEVIKSVFGSASAFSKESGQASSAPMTIFYNGTVSVFNVPHHHAENIFHIARQGSTKMCIDPKPSSDSIDLLQHFTNGLTVSRRRSLKYFMEKRRERVTMKSSPYGCTFPNQHNTHNSPPPASSISLSLSLSQDQVHNPITM